MPLHFGKDGGSLLWVRNPFTGAVTYFTDVHKKRSGFPPPPAAADGGTSNPAIPATLEAIRRSCPFCPGNEAMTTAEVLRVRPDPPDGNGEARADWLIRAFHNLVPRIPERCTGGRNESYVVVEDPRHFVDAPRNRDDLLFSGFLPEAQTRAVLQVDAAVARIAYENPAVETALIRKNQGPQSGASQPHVHNQVIGLDRPLPPVLQEHERLVEEPDLWWRIIDFARSEGFLIEERDGCFLYFCPFGTFPRSYEIVFPELRCRLTELEGNTLDVFAALLHRALATLGPSPLDYEIHDGPLVPLHAHVNSRNFAYSNIGGTLNLPAGLPAGSWQFPPARPTERPPKRD
jgi:galactose-1-phosphate uridylyltransferase